MNRTPKLHCFTESILLSVSKRERNIDSRAYTISRLRQDIRCVGIRVIERGQSIRTTARALDYSEDFVTALLCAYVAREVEAAESSAPTGELAEGFC